MNVDCSIARARACTRSHDSIRNGSDNPPFSQYTHRYYYIGLAIELLNVAACVAVIIKIRRRRRGAARGDTGMTRLIDDLVLILAWYYLAYDIILGNGVYLAFLLPYDWSTAMQVVRALDLTAEDCSVRSMD